MGSSWAIPRAVVILCAITSHFTTPIDKTMPMACFPIHHRPANTCWARPVSFFCHPAHRPAPVLPRGASMSHDSAAWHASTASTAPQRKGGRPCQFALSVALERSCVARHPVLFGREFKHGEIEGHIDWHGGGLGRCRSLLWGLLPCHACRDVLNCPLGRHHRLCCTIWPWAS